MIRRAAFHSGLGALLLVALDAPALAQKLGQGPIDDGVSIWRVVAALLLCMLLAVAGAFAVRLGMRRGLFVIPGIKREGRLQLVETLRLANQIDLCIVTCDGCELLVSASPQGTQLLSRLPVDATKP